MQDKYLSLELSRALNNIDLFIEKLDAEEYYSDNSKEFLEILKQFVKTLKDNFKEIPPSRYNSLLQSLNFKVVPRIRYVQRSQTRNVPWSLIPNLEKIIRELLGEDFIILLRPQWHWNYSVLVSNITEYLQLIIDRYIGQKDLVKFKKSIHIISFPILEKKNFLLHTIIGHEIGHFYQQKYFRKYLTNEWEIQTLKLLMDRLSESQPSSGRKERGELLTDATEVIQIYKGMIREIIPDIIGYLILGPSIIFTHYYFSFWNKDDDFPSKKNDYYPPLKYRLRILFESLFEQDILRIKNNRNKSSKTILSFHEQIKIYLNEKNDKYLLKNNNRTNIALTLFERDLKSILDFSTNEIGNKTYRFNIKTIEALINRIEETIPPNEIECKPVMLGDIFLSGWVYYHRMLNNDKSFTSSPKEYIDNYEILSRLLLKASNLTYIHQYFEEKRNVNTE